jgi:long-chain acyl-CoA synthetase
MSTVAASALSPSETASAPRTVPGWLLHQARERPRATALRVKDLGRWQETTWAEYAERVAGVGRALMHMGVAPGSRVAIISGNRAEWMITDLAIQGTGAATVTVSVTAPPGQTAEMLTAAEVDVAIVEDEEQLDKVTEVRDRLALRHVIVFDPRGIRRLEDPVSGFEALEALGSQDAVRARDADADAWVKSVEALDPAGVATIVFTSGATGEPKGARLTHAALTAGGSAASEVLGLRAGDEIVSTLPLTDIAERSLAVVQAVQVGAVVNFGEGGLSLGNDFREVEPTVVLGSPRVWERLKEGIDAGERGAGFVKRRAMKIARSFDGALTRLLVQRPLHANVGLARTRIAISATASCGNELIQYWRALGLPLRQAYSVTEAAGFAAITRPDDAAGSVGPALAGVELNVGTGAFSEVLLRTAAPFAGHVTGTGDGDDTTDDWFHTGDVGVLDGGVLTITGRTKDVVTTSSGRHASPRMIESALEESPYVRTAVVVGSERPCLGALVVIDATTVGDWAAARGSSFTTFATLTALPEVRGLVDEVVQKTNESLDAHGRVECFCVLPQELGDDEELVTDTHKIRRGPIAARFDELIERMYAERGATP